MWIGVSKSGGSAGVKDDDYFGRLYAHLATCFGWTWEYIDENMTMERLASCDLYWKESPPIHILVAQYLGYTKPPGEEENTKTAEENCAALFNALGGNEDVK